jgi:hypothetical protein
MRQQAPQQVIPESGSVYAVAALGQGPMTRLILPLDLPNALFSFKRESKGQPGPARSARPPLPGCAPGRMRWRSPAPLPRGSLVIVLS